MVSIDSLDAYNGYKSMVAGVKCRLLKLYGIRKTKTKHDKKNPIVIYVIISTYCKIKIHWECWQVNILAVSYTCQLNKRRVNNKK